MVIGLFFGVVDESVGFLLFMLSIGYYGVRRGVSAERRLISIESELATARRIQASILPDEMPRLPSLRIAARYLPMSAVAGDLYDFHELDNGRLGVIVADVSGHGVPAALIASMVKVLGSAESARHRSPERILDAMNHALRGSLGRQFVTATYLMFDVERGSVTVANGGHPAPLLRRESSGEWIELGGTGPLIGRFSDAAYAASTTDLRKGDRIIAYTDGIVEALNAAERPFGEKRLHRVVEECGATSCDELADAVIREVQGWAKTPGDDLTIVVLELC